MKQTKALVKTHLKSPTKDGKNQRANQEDPTNRLATKLDFN